MARKISNPRVPSWPQQCSPLSTVFDLIKVADEERHGLPGPILTVDRYVARRRFFLLSNDPLASAPL